MARAIPRSCAVFWSLPWYAQAIHVIKLVLVFLWLSFGLQWCLSQEPGRAEEKLF